MIEQRRLPKLHPHICLWQPSHSSGMKSMVTTCSKQCCGSWKIPWLGTKMFSSRRHSFRAYRPMRQGRTLGARGQKRTTEPTVSIRQRCWSRWDWRTLAPRIDRRTGTQHLSAVSTDATRFVFQKSSINYLTTWTSMRHKVKVGVTVSFRVI